VDRIHGCAQPFGLLLPLSLLACEYSYALFPGPLTAGSASSIDGKNSFAFNDGRLYNGHRSELGASNGSNGSLADDSDPVDSILRNQVRH
jgi:hypothetical protein